MITRKARGRPRKEVRRENNLKVRLNDSEMSMLLDMSSRTGESYSEVLRRALRICYRMGKI